MHKSNFLALSILVVFISSSFSCSKKQYVSKQSGMEVKKPQEEVLTYAEVIAQFPGGENNMMQWLSDHINYPTEAAQKGIEGIVVTRFIIDATGNIKDPEVFRSSGNDLLDKEALRVVSLMPDWIPSEHKGKKVAMYYMLPIRFKMPNRLPAEFVNPTK